MRCVCSRPAMALRQRNQNSLSEKSATCGVPGPWKKPRRSSKSSLLDLGPPLRVPVCEADADSHKSATTFPVSHSPMPQLHECAEAGKTGLTSSLQLPRETSTSLAMESHTGTRMSQESHTGTRMSQVEVPPSHNHKDSHTTDKVSLPNVPSELPVCQPSHNPSHLPPRHPSSSRPHPPPSSHPPTSHLPTYHTPSSHCSTVHPASSHPPTSNTPIAHPPTTHTPSTHPPTTHPSTSHPPTTHTPSTHPPTTHPSTSHPPTTHTPSTHPPTTHTSTSHPPTMHTPSTHPPTTHPHPSPHPTPTVAPPSFFLPPKDEDIVVMRPGKEERRFRRLELLGRGGSSKVYKVISEDYKIFALKEVYLKYVDSKVKQAYIKEINFLKGLKNVSEVVTLHCFSWDKREGILHLLLEYADTDLSSVIRSSGPSISTALYFWNQMLRILVVIHDEGIIHNDLKPENFVCVRGRLKLIDFGIANRIEDEHTSVERDLRCGTINYMSPETIETHGDEDFFKVGRPSDVWSLGCILYQMLYGHTPFDSYKKLHKLQAIINPSVTIPFPDIGNPSAIDVMKKCLNRNTRQRPTVTDLLSHPFTLCQTSL